LLYPAGMSRTAAGLLTIALLTCGCGSTVRYTPVVRSAGLHRGRPVQSVDVYLSGPPTRPHRDLGLLEAKQESDLSLDGTRAMLHKLRARAARIGCDAISLNSVGSRTAPALAVDISHASSVKTVTATCIRYLDGDGDGDS
jgi:hypothetical protein